MSSSETGVALHCAIHRGTETSLRCGSCGTPICPKCLVMTPVGAKCPTCARPRLQSAFVLTPFDVIVAVIGSIAGGVVLGIIGSIVLRFAPIASILFPMICGLGCSALVQRVTPRKRGVPLKIAAALGVVIAFLVLGLGDFVVREPIGLIQTGIGLMLLRNVLIGLIINPFNALFLGLGIWLAIYRTD